MMNPRDEAIEEVIDRGKANFKDDDLAAGFKQAVKRMERRTGWIIGSGKPCPMTEAELAELQMDHPDELIPIRPQKEWRVWGRRFRLINDYGRDPIGGRVAKRDVIAEALTYDHEAHQNRRAYLEELASKRELGGRPPGNHTRGRRGRKNAQASERPTKTPESGTAPQKPGKRAESAKATAASMRSAPPSRGRATRTAGSSSKPRGKPRTSKKVSPFASPAKRYPRGY